MNRKISTLLTAGLLVAGSLCGSAFAQNSIPVSYTHLDVYKRQILNYVLFNMNYNLMIVMTPKVQILSASYNFNH